MSKNRDPEKVVREIKRKTRRKFSAEEKIRIVLEGFRGDDTIAEICRREGISPNLYYNWSKDFLETGKRRLMGDTKREATSSEVSRLKREILHLKEMFVSVDILVNSQLRCRCQDGRFDEPNSKWQ